MATRPACDGRPGGGLPNPKETPLIWAWIGAAVVGLSLGLLGSGGAILTVPILVYLVGHDEKTAIVESLAIVGIIALVGAVRAGLARRLDFRSALLLAIPGIAGTYLGALLAGLISGAVQLVILSGLMLAAAALMFRSGGGAEVEAGADSGVEQGGSGARPGRAEESEARSPAALGVVALQGVALGMATGLVGVGGGFLIVPVLVLVRRLPMPTAVGTSLAIITINCASGLVSYALGAGAADPIHPSPRIVAIFAALGIGGSLVGSALAGRIKQGTLKRIFAVFLVVMAGYILVRQAPRVLPGVFGGGGSVSAGP